MSFNNFIYIHSDDGRGRANQISDLSYTLKFINEIRKTHELEIALYSIHFDNVSLSVELNVNDTISIAESRDGQADLIIDAILTPGTYTPTEFFQMFDNILNAESSANGFSLDYSSSMGVDGELIVINSNLNNGRLFQFQCTTMTDEANALIGCSGDTDEPAPPANLYISELLVFFRFQNRVTLKTNLIRADNYNTSSADVEDILLDQIQFYNSDNTSNFSGLDHFDFYPPNLIYQKSNNINRTNFFLRMNICCSNIPFPFKAGMKYSVALAYKISPKEDERKQQVLLTLKDIKALLKVEKDKDKLKEEVKGLKTEARRLKDKKK